MKPILAIVLFFLCSTFAFANVDVVAAPGGAAYSQSEGARYCQGIGRHLPTKIEGRAIYGQASDDLGNFDPAKLAKILRDPRPARLRFWIAGRKICPLALEATDDPTLWDVFEGNEIGPYRSRVFANCGSNREFTLCVR